MRVNRPYQRVACGSQGVQMNSMPTAAQHRCQKHLSDRLVRAGVDQSLISYVGAGQYHFDTQSPRFFYSRVQFGQGWQ